mmetsp:Transcript_25267/g.52830  ORF Transcript_25267/g.52830 Transcript_25267/m.52830 type:complete len:248 (-) Transcript_25267:1151-1894(-)
MRLPIVYEESTWLAVNKPAGLAAHGSSVGGLDSEVSLASLLSEQCSMPVHPVHRLDRDTSGCMLFAKTPAAAAELQRSLKRAETSKCYQAVLRGEVGGHSGQWTQPLTGKAESRRNPQGLSRARLPTTTCYQVISLGHKLSFVELTLGSTGRTHQIRKHAAVNRHAVIGDRRYGDPKYNARMSEQLTFSGMALHAARLRLALDSGSVVTVQAELPESWEAMLETLQLWLRSALVLKGETSSATSFEG